MRAALADAMAEAATPPRVERGDGPGPTALDKPEKENTTVTTKKSWAPLSWPPAVTSQKSR